MKQKHTWKQLYLKARKKYRESYNYKYFKLYVYCVYRYNKSNK